MNHEHTENTHETEVTPENTSGEASAETTSEDTTENATESTEKSAEGESPQSDADESEQSPEEDRQQKNREINFAELRKKAQKLEKERNEAIKRAQQIEEQQQKNQGDPRPQNTQSPTEDATQETPSIDPNDFVEGRHLSQYEKKLQKIEQQQKRIAEQQQQSLVQNRLKSEFSDFDDVVNEDNVQTLRLTYPEIAETINASSDLYNKAVSTYRIIKNMGIDKSDNSVRNQQRVKENATKPRSAQSVAPRQSDSPLANANQYDQEMTDEQRQQLYEQMRRDMRS